MKKLLLFGCFTLPICIEQVCGTGQEPKGQKIRLDLSEMAGTDLTNALFSLRQLGETEKTDKLADEFLKDHKTLIPESVAQKNPALLQKNKEKNEKLITKLRNGIFEAGIQLFETLLKNPQGKIDQLNELKTMLMNLPALTTTEKKKLDEVSAKLERLQKEEGPSWKLYHTAGVELTNALKALEHINAEIAENITQQFTQDHDRAKLRENVITECKNLLKKESLGQPTKFRIIHILEELPDVTKVEKAEFENLRKTIVATEATESFD